MPLVLLPNDDIDSVNSMVTSEPLKDAPGTFIWRILARTCHGAQSESDKVSLAVSDRGFVAFTAPHRLETGPFQYWFQMIGVSYDLTT